MHSDKILSSSPRLIRLKKLFHKVKLSSTLESSTDVNQQCIKAFLPSWLLKSQPTHLNIATSYTRYTIRPWRLYQLSFLVKGPSRSSKLLIFPSHRAPVVVAPDVAGFNLFTDLRQVKIGLSCCCRLCSVSEQSSEAQPKGEIIISSSYKTKKTLKKRHSYSSLKINSKYSFNI